MTGGVIIYVKAANLCGHCATAIQQGCSVVAIAKTNNQTIWYTAFRKRKLHVGSVCICGPNRDPPHDGNLQTSSYWSTNKLSLKPPQRSERDSASYSWNRERIFVDNLVDVFSLHEAMETLSNRITSFKYDFPSSVVHILAWLPQTTSSQAEDGRWKGNTTFKIINSFSFLGGGVLLVSHFILLDDVIWTDSCLRCVRPTPELPRLSSVQMS